MICPSPLYIRRGGGGGIFALLGFGEEYRYLLLHFLLFLRVFGLFLRYACSISLRELNNAI